MSDILDRLRVVRDRLGLRSDTESRDVSVVCGDAIAAIEQRDAEIARLCLRLRELVDAMHRYEMDVDGDADKPQQHRDMMERAEAALAAQREEP